MRKISILPANYSPFQLNAIQMKLLRIRRTGMSIPQECIRLNRKPLYYLLIATCYLLLATHKSNLLTKNCSLVTIY